MESSPPENFFNAVRESISAGTFVKLTLGKRRGGDPTLKNVYVRLVNIRDADQLSLTYRHVDRDVVKNHAVEDGLSALGEILGREFLSGHLFTTGGDLQLEYNKKLSPRLIHRKATFGAPPPPAHDRNKRRFVRPEGNVYLRALGVTNGRGEVREKMGDKFRQINKFVETIAQLFASSPLRDKAGLSIADMGAGKGYLTFAVYDYFRNTLGLDASVVGVEARAELVELCNRVAGEAGFDRLQFRKGLIRDYEPGAADVLIALHACDTATDEALFKGVRAGASIIITAPCCHKELRPQVEPPRVLGGLLKHGIILERQAEMLTDALRALLLESAGYKTRVFEFVSTEHTPKNTMIAAVRHGRATDREGILRQIEELKNFYGVSEQSLERMLLRGRSCEA